jgi:hypothetical protein
MAGPVFFVVIVIVVGLLIAASVNVFLLVPLVVIGLGALVWAPIIAAFGGRLKSRSEPGGVPSTGEAAYDPQVRPQGPRTD